MCRGLFTQCILEDMSGIHKSVAWVLGCTGQLVKCVQYILCLRSSPLAVLNLVNLTEVYIEVGAWLHPPPLIQVEYLLFSDKKLYFGQTCDIFSGRSTTHPPLSPFSIIAPDIWFLPWCFKTDLLVIANFAYRHCCRYWMYWKEVHLLENVNYKNYTVVWPTSICINLIPNF